jgi:hypothetical protein
MASNNNTTTNLTVTSSKTVYSYLNSFINNYGLQLLDIKTNSIISNNLSLNLSKTSIKFDTINMVKISSQNTAQKLSFLFK